MAIDRPLAKNLIEFGNCSSGNKANISRIFCSKVALKMTKINQWTSVG